MGWLKKTLEAAVATTFLSASSASAYHTEPIDKIVHPWTVGQITELALENKEIPEGLFKEQLKKYKNQVIQASIDEDYFPKYPDWDLSNDFGKFDPGGVSMFFPKELLDKFRIFTKPSIDRLLPNIRCARHYYEPVSEKGLQFHIQWKSNLDFMLWLQEDAKKAWAGCDYEKAFYRLGQMMHLLVESPAHYNAINHAPPAILGSNVPFQSNPYKNVKTGDVIEDWCATKSPSDVFPDIKQLVAKIPAFTEKDLREIQRKVAKAQNVITAHGLVGEILSNHFYLDCKRNIGGYSNYNFSDKELRDLVRITIPLQIKAGGTYLREFGREVGGAVVVSMPTKSATPSKTNIYRTLANIIKAKGTHNKKLDSFEKDFYDKKYGKCRISYSTFHDSLIIYLFSNEIIEEYFVDDKCDGMLGRIGINETRGKFGDDWSGTLVREPRNQMELNRVREKVSKKYDSIVKHFVQII